MVQSYEQTLRANIQRINIDTMEETEQRCCLPKPDVGCFAVNFDSTYINHVGGWGAVASSSYGDVLAMVNCNSRHHCIAHIELEAAEYGIWLIILNGARKILLETDSSNVVAFMKG